MTKIQVVFLIMLGLCALAPAEPKDNKGPDLCSSTATMTLAVLEQHGLVDPKQIDSAATWVTRLASEKIHKNVWHQLYFVTFKLRTGEAIEAIAVVNASPKEDWRAGPVVYVVSQVLNPDGKPEPAKR